MTRRAAVFDAQTKKNASLIFYPLKMAIPSSFASVPPLQPPPIPFSTLKALQPLLKAFKRECSSCHGLECRILYYIQQEQDVFLCESCNLMDNIPKPKPKNPIDDASAGPCKSVAIPALNSNGLSYNDPEIPAAKIVLSVETSNVAPDCSFSLLEKSKLNGTTNSKQGNQKPLFPYATAPPQVSFDAISGIDLQGPTSAPSPSIYSKPSREKSVKEPKPVIYQTERVCRKCNTTKTVAWYRDSTGHGHNCRKCYIRKRKNS